MDKTNLDMLFIDLLPSYSFLVEQKTLTKAEFLDVLKHTYSISTIRNRLFYESCERSEFKTIRRDLVKNTILFNQ